MRRLFTRPRRILAAALLTLAVGALPVAAQGWDNPSPRQIEEFLTVFAPDAAAIGEAGPLAAPIERLIAIERAYNAGDKLTALDLVAGTPDGPLFPALREAQDAILAIRGLSQFWGNEASRTAFLRFYNEVYLRDPALAADPEAFAVRFQQGASLVDGQDPARYLYEHLAHYGYMPTMSLDPAFHFHNLYRSFDRSLVDAAKLGLGIDGLQVALPEYREAVLQRLVSQIAAAKKFAEQRAASVEGWGAVIEGTQENATPVEAVPPLYPPEGPAVAEAEEPATEPAAIEPLLAGEPVVELEVPATAEPAPAEPEPAADGSDWTGVDIFSTPGAESPAAAEIPAGDPVVFEDAASTAGEEVPAESTELIAPEGDAPVTEPRGEWLEPTEPVAEVVEPVEPAPAEGVPAPVDPAAAEAAGQMALDATLAAARTLGQQATALVLLWNAPEGDGPADREKIIEAEEEKLVTQKELFL
ncbi:MAG TPA: hypothetical protein VEI97_08460, partial [bacterium]|nr:hypothetical protein [bacterium]